MCSLKTKSKCPICIANNKDFIINNNYFLNSLIENFTRLIDQEMEKIKKGIRPLINYINS